MDWASSSTSLPLSTPSHEGVQEDISHIMSYVDQSTPPPKATFDSKGKQKADLIPSEDEASSVDSEDEVMGQLAGGVDSDSETDSSDSDTSSDESESILTASRRARLKTKIDEAILGPLDGDGDDEDDPKPTPTSFNTKNQIEPEVKPPPVSMVEEDERLELVGEVMSVVNSVVIVKAHQGGDNRVLDTDSLLVFDDRKVLGLVFEAFGPITHPMYTVRFTSAADIDAAAITVSRKVYHVSNRSSFLFTSALRAMKGSDASNVYDEEVGDDEMAFSDDEKEAEHKRKLRGENSRSESHQPESNASGSNRGTGTPRQQPRSFAEEDTDIFYGDAYDDAPQTHETNQMSSTPARPLPQAYDDDALPYDSTLPNPSSSKVMEDGEVDDGPRDSKRGARGKRGRRGERGERGERGRGGGRNGHEGGDHSGSGRGRARGERGTRGRGRGAAARGPENGDRRRSSSNGNWGASSSSNEPPPPADRAQEEYDPRQPRPLSPTSLAIARATGQWDDIPPSQRTQLQPAAQGNQYLGYQNGYNDYNPGGYVPPAAYGMLPPTQYSGRQPLQTQFVAPHINPRFNFQPGFNFQAYMSQFQAMQPQQQQDYYQDPSVMMGAAHMGYGDNQGYGQQHEFTSAGNDGGVANSAPIANAPPETPSGAPDHGTTSEQ